VCLHAGVCVVNNTSMKKCVNYCVMIVPLIVTICVKLDSIVYVCLTDCAMYKYYRMILSYTNVNNESAKTITQV
jgi:hypothetical protein